MKEVLVTYITYGTTFLTFVVQLLTIVKLRKEIKGSLSITTRSSIRLLMVSGLLSLVFLGILVFLTLFHPLAAPPVFGTISIEGNQLNRQGTPVQGPGGRRECICDVPFSRSFVRPPQVQVSLGGWETASPLLQVYVEPNSAKSDGFKVHLLWKQDQPFGDAGVKLNYTCAGSHFK